MTKTGIIIASTLGGVGVATAVAVPTAIVLTQNKGEDMSEFDIKWDEMVKHFGLQETETTEENGVTITNPITYYIYVKNKEDYSQGLEITTIEKEGIRIANGDLNVIKNKYYDDVIQNSKYPSKTLHYGNKEFNF